MLRWTPIGLPEHGQRLLLPFVGRLPVVGGEEDLPVTGEGGDGDRRFIPREKSLMAGRIEVDEIDANGLTVEQHASVGRHVGETDVGRCAVQLS